MTLASMTGFTRLSGAHESYHWIWEIKSVNGKGLDIRLRLPPGFDDLERPIRSAMGAQLTRGSCFVTLTVKNEASRQTLRVNQQVLDAVLDAMAVVEDRLDAKKPGIDGILAIKGVLEPVEEEESEEARAKLIKALMGSFGEAVTDLATMRGKEGALLEGVVLQRVDEIEALTRQAEDSPARQPDAIRDKLRLQIERVIEADKGLDEDRLYQEAVLLAGKADIREELDRLYAHCSAVRALVAETRPVGRKLDFLAQEFNREANTLCSKSNDTSLTAIGLELKAAIEQLREQIQNVE